MKAIETVYNGYRFRSRLEARWAVYFDSLGIEYQYEPEGFEFEDVGRYLPDFWLPQVDMWAEVKPAELNLKELMKCAALARMSSHEVLLLVGPPSFREYEAVALHHAIGVTEDDPVDFYKPGLGLDCWAYPYTLCTEYLWENRFFGQSCYTEEQDFDDSWPEIRKGIEAARSARFEFGDNPGRRLTHG